VTELAALQLYSRVLNIIVGLNKSVGANFSWKLIKKIFLKINKKVELNKNVGGIFFLKFNKNVIPNRSAGGIFFC